MKVSELFEVKKAAKVPPRKDMLGTVHKGCGGKFEETSIHDDWDGLVHCSKCNQSTKRHPDPLTPVKESGATRGYDTSPKNREHYDDFKEWETAVRRAGADTFKKTETLVGAMGHDGECGEFDKSAGSGWLVDKWTSKKVNEDKKVEGGWAKIFKMKAVLENKPLFIDLLKQYKKAATKEHAAYMKRGTPGQRGRDWYETRDALNKEMKDISKEFQTMFAQRGEKNTIEFFDRENETALEFFKAVTTDVMNEGSFVKNLKRLAAGKTVHQRAAQEITKSQEASTAGDEKKAEKHFKRYDKMSKLSEILTLAEGMWVVKSKDGVEKRFKNADSAEAKAWKEKTAKKVSVPKEKYSAEWWNHKHEKADFYSDDEALYPWSKIGPNDLSGDVLADAFKNAGYNMKNVDDWSAQGKSQIRNVKGLDVSFQPIRIVYFYSKEDDIGVEGDEPVSDSQIIYVSRDTKNPKKFVFAGYGH